MAGQAETTRDANTYWAAFRPWLWLAVLCAVLGAAGAFAVTKIQRPVYRATTLLIVNPQAAATSSDTSQMATTYAQLVDEPVVIQAASRQVIGESASDLATRVTVSAQSNTPLISVNVDDTSATRAAALSNAVAKAFISAINSQGIADRFPVLVFQPAAPPAHADHPNPTRNGLVGGALGLVLGIVLIHLLNAFDDRGSAAQTGEQLAERTVEEDGHFGRTPGIEADTPRQRPVGKPMMDASGYGSNGNF